MTTPTLVAAGYTVDVKITSREMSGAISSSAAANTSYKRATAAAAMRAAYVAIMGSEGHPPDNWKEVFIVTGKLLVDELLAHRAKKEAEMKDHKLDTVIWKGTTEVEDKKEPLVTASQPYRVCAQLRNQTSDVILDTDKTVILVGRLPNCDVLLSPSGTSRLHMVIFVMPALGKTAIVDVGSSTGIIMLKRGSAAPMVHSTQTSRRVIMLDLYETAVFQCGSDLVSVN
jgi:hypothetical protein